MQNGLVVLSLVILLGYTGQLSLGQAGLVAVGAYAYGILCVNYGVSPWLGLVIAPLIAGLVGLLLGVPSFKLTGPLPCRQHDCLLGDRPYPHLEQREAHGRPLRPQPDSDDPERTPPLLLHVGRRLSGGGLHASPQPIPHRACLQGHPRG